MYTIESISRQLKERLIAYLQADYHILNDSLIEARFKLLDNDNVIANEPRLEGSKRYPAGESYDNMHIPDTPKNLLDQLSKIPNSGVWPTPRKHQQKAIEIFLQDKDDLIVATGTGSGKTETFLYPIFGSLALENKNPNTLEMSGVRCLLLYPMNALVNDQLTRLRGILGNKDCKKIFKEVRGRHVTFGTYTSKTQYPGPKTAKKEKDLIKKLQETYLPNDSETSQKLEKYNLYPAKDIATFTDSECSINMEDAELYTRHEVQQSPPDILITNYSMLEYMMLRPIERDIFTKTKAWLEADKSNYFTVVLDEAHIYKGVLGSEISYLLKRLYSRLNIPRERVRIIITTASIGEENTKAKDFAQILTGKSTENTFQIIQDEVFPIGDIKHSDLKKEIEKIGDFNINCIHDYKEINEPINQLTALFKSLKLSGLSNSISSIEELKNEMFELLGELNLAKKLYKVLTEDTKTYQEAVDEVCEGNKKSFEVLTTLCSFAQDKESKQVFMPIRLHNMFRGIPGLFACINPACEETKKNIETKKIFGKLYTSPRIQCDKCGGRVYEVLTHRDCGAAYIRAYCSKDKGLTENEMLHNEQSFIREDDLQEAHLFIEINEIYSTERVNTDYNFIHIFSGKILLHDPGDSINYIKVVPGKYLEKPDLEAVNALGFEKCKACGKATKVGGRLGAGIQAHMTQGEQPFSYIMHELISSQPKDHEKSPRQYPLQGRKAVLFSDGRQKAARLAVGIPRATERDTFRVLLALTFQDMNKSFKIDYEEDGWKYKSLNINIVYYFFLKLVKKKNLNFFAGHAAERIKRDIIVLENINPEYLKTELEEEVCSELKPGQKFKEEFLRAVTNKFYSLQTFLIGALVPEERSFVKFIRRVCVEDPTLKDKKELLRSIIVNRFSEFCLDHQGFGSPQEFNQQHHAGANEALFSKFPAPIGVKKTLNKNFYKDESGFIGGLTEAQTDIINNNIFSVFMDPTDNIDLFKINNKKVWFEFKYKKSWFKCKNCMAIAMLLIDQSCPSCKGKDNEELSPTEDNWLKARKGFYKDPCVKALDDDTDVLNLIAQEHTAQLSHQDKVESFTTNEKSEFRFKDILLEDDDVPIDLLSCTTTMEVGVDIGSLSAVGMRNVPPERQNYQQRAGRSGRRGSSISNVVTYAQTGSHDSYYFDNPEKIINTAPPAPKIDAENDKITNRHIWANLMQLYFHSENTLFETDTENKKTNDLLHELGDTRNFYEDTSSKFNISSFERWGEVNLASNKLISELEWTTKQYDINEVFKKLINELRKHKPDFDKDDEQYEKKLLYFLFTTANILPSYAFPLRMCEFPIQDTNGKEIECPTQRLDAAIVEYAPGRFLTVNGENYTIVGVAAKKVGPKRAEYLFENKKTYSHCKDCKNTSNETMDRCDNCKSENTEKLTVIEPTVVYGKKRDAGEDDRYSGASTAELLIQDLDEGKFKEVSDNSKKITLEDQDLLKINLGPNNEGYAICEKCGVDNQNVNGNNTPYKMYGGNSGRCDHSYSKVNLGFEYKSDVFLLRTELAPEIEIDEKNIYQIAAFNYAAQTLSEAIIQASAKIQDIDPREIGAGHKIRQEDNAVDIHICDNSAGGAGYALQISPFIQRHFIEGKEYLEKDCCEISCYLCLQNFGNRHHHKKIDKKYGLALLAYIEENILPDQYNEKKQHELAFTIIKLLELDGALVQPNNGRLIFTKDGVELNVYIYPAFYNTNYIEGKFPDNGVWVSDFEATKSPTTAYEKIIQKLNG